MQAGHSLLSCSPDLPPSSPNGHQPPAAHVDNQSTFRGSLRPAPSAHHQVGGDSSGTDTSLVPLAACPSPPQWWQQCWESGESSMGSTFRESSSPPLVFLICRVETLRLTSGDHGGTHAAAQPSAWLWCASSV